jgi:hypothetical protein
MRICRDGHAACAEALRTSKGIAAAADPAAMKWRRLNFADMVPSLNFSEGIASSGFCHVRKTGQIGAFNENAGFPHMTRKRANPMTVCRSLAGFGGQSVVGDGALRSAISR